MPIGVLAMIVVAFLGLFRWGAEKANERMERKDMEARYQVQEQEPEWVIVRNSSGSYVVTEVRK